MLRRKAMQQLLLHTYQYLLLFLMLPFTAVSIKATSEQTRPNPEWMLQGILARPFSDPTVIAVLGRNVSLSCLVTVPDGINVTQISWEKVYPSGRRNVAVYNPIYGPSVQEEYKGRFDFKTDATLLIDDVGFSDSGEYVCKVATFPLGNIEATVVVRVLVEPAIFLTKGSDLLVDGGNETVAAECTAAYGKPVAEISWEGNLGRTDVRSSLFPNETATILSQYKVIPTRFARGRQITCVVQHPTLKTPVRIPYTLDILYAPEVSVTGYDGNWFVGRENVQLNCLADANPPSTSFLWSRADGLWPEGLQQVNHTLLFTKPLSLNHSGVYICEVTNDLGQRSSQKSVGIRDDPLTQTSPAAVVGAVTGAVLSLFIITVFIIALLTPRKKRPSYQDKVIELPPTHKPAPAYKERSVDVFLKENTLQNQSKSCHCQRQDGRPKEADQQLRPTYTREWSGCSLYPRSERVYIKPREHYV